VPKHPSRMYRDYNSSHVKQYVTDSIKFQSILSQLFDLVDSVEESPATLEFLQYAEGVRKFNG